MRGLCFVHCLVLHISVLHVFARFAVFVYLPFDVW